MCIRDSSTSDWANQTSGAWVAYDNDDNIAEVHGFLYNGYAVIDNRGLCPDGWSAGSDDDWMQLESSAGIPESELNSTGNRGAGTNAAYTIKAAPPSSNGTNELGFTALDSGIQHEHGGFQYLGTGGTWWTSSSTNPNTMWRRGTNATDIIHRSTFDARAGFSVRCVKD